MMPEVLRAPTKGRAFAGHLALRTALTSFLQSLLVLGFLAGVTLPAAAQSEEPAPAEEGTSEPAAPSTEENPAAPSGQENPNARLGGKFQDWQMVCEIRGENKEEVCGAVQEVMTKDGKLALWTAFGYLQPAAGPVMIFRIPYELTDPPSGFRVSKGAHISVDGGAQVEVPIEVCAPGGCQIGLLLDDAFVKALKAGNKLNLIMPLATGQNATINVSLLGFTAAFDSLKKPS